MEGDTERLEKHLSDKIEGAPEVEPIVGTANVGLCKTLYWFQELAKVEPLGADNSLEIC